MAYSQTNMKVNLASLAWLSLGLSLMYRKEHCVFLIIIYIDLSMDSQELSQLTTVIPIFPMGCKSPYQRLSAAAHFTSPPSTHYYRHAGALSALTWLDALKLKM